ncbi:MAG: hypothetical protein Q9M37_04920 [Desulfonauticus sp.]|nr:hypothetical protein [Desulfonauticus sp.]
MELIAYLIIILVIAILDSILIAYLNARYQKQVAAIAQEKSSLTNTYNTLKKEIEEIQKKINELELQLSHKKFLEQTKQQKAAEEEDKITDPLTYIKKHNLVPPEEIKRAEEYVQKTATNLSVFDTLVLLDIIDEKTALSIKEKVRKNSLSLL